ncbi:MAG: hypothetical protein OEY93_05935 [Anaerolineae bacterium]|nr:hypothetical protein [Anaerolineae bacterium]
MQSFSGKLTAVKISPSGQNQAVISAPRDILPGPGQYLQVHLWGDHTEALGYQVFLGDVHHQFLEGDVVEFTTAGEFPDGWEIGSQLALQGHFGRGFSGPGNARRVGLAVLGPTFDRLNPLSQLALQSGADISVFGDIKINHLSPQIEVRPLNELPDSMSWMDYLAVDIPSGKLEEIPRLLSDSPSFPAVHTAEILVDITMPCSGIADCRVCEISAGNQKPVLVCKQGPVINWGDLY